MTAYPHKLTTPSDREIRVERVFAASRDFVWRAFSDPNLVARWWGRGNKVVVEKFEFRKGGHWRFVEHADGQQHGFEGRYADIKAPERIVQTFEYDGAPGEVVLETATFEAIDATHTRMVNVSLFFTKEARDGMVKAGMEAGMAESYAALDKLLTSL